MFKKKSSRKLLVKSLDELADILGIDDDSHNISADYPRKKRKKRAVWTRVSLWFLGSIFLITVLLVGGLLYITSPVAEKHVRSFVVDAVNDAGKDYGFHIRLGSIGGFWGGKIEIHDLRVHDNFGPWLYVDQGTLHPEWTSLLRGIVAFLQYAKNGTFSQALISDVKPLMQMPSTNTEALYRDMDTQTNQPTSKETAQQTGSFEAKLKMLSPEKQVKYIDNLLEPLPLLENKVVIALKLGTLLGVRMPRFPRYLAGEDVENQKNADQDPISFLPSWLAVDVGELELVHFQLGHSGRDLRISARVHGQITDDKMRLRSTVLAAKVISSQWVLPPVYDLPKSVSLSLRSLRKRLEDVPANEVDYEARKNNPLYNSKSLLGFLSFDMDGGLLDMRVHMRDALLTPYFVPGVKAIWTRSRFLGDIKSFSPSPDKPIQGKLVSRFGMSLVQGDYRIKSSMLDGQFFWDGTKLVVRDVTVQSPVRNTNLEFEGSLGYSPTAGFGTKLTLETDDISHLISMLGIDTQAYPMKGEFSFDANITRGGPWLMWWTKPLPSIQEGREFPDFTFIARDSSVLARHIQRAYKDVFATIQKLVAALPLEKGAKGANSATTKTQASESKLPKVSKYAAPLRMIIKAESPLLTTPNGDVKDFFFSVHASSIDVDTAPAGTAFSKKKQVSSAKDDQEKKVAAVDSTPKDISVGQKDFTSDGLPRGLVGTVFLRAGDMFKMGVGTFTGNWFLGGYHGDADVLQLEFEKLSLELPGIKSNANVGFAYALPRVKRRWPWVDGNFNLHMEHGDWVSLFTDAPFRVDNLHLGSRFHSSLNELKIPSQFLNASITAERVESTGFMVKNISGFLNSHHVHALADSVGLSIGALREALERKMEYTPPADYSLLDSSLRLSSGRSGGLRWSSGQADLQVQGEQANFSVHMYGDLSALLEGTFNFRRRVLSLKDLQFDSK